MQSNPKVTNYPVPAKGAGWLLLTTTMMCSKAVVQEDPANANFGQGLTGYYLDPTDLPAAQAEADALANGTLQVWLKNDQGENGPAYQPIIFGGSDGRVHGGEGNYVGAGGTPLLLLQSNSAETTGVILQEWP